MSGDLIGLVLLAAVLLLFGTMAYGAISAAPWVPLGRRDTERMVAAASLEPGQVLVDLGCGDGRILAAAAKRGFTAIGYEVAFLPYFLAQARRLFSPHRRRMKVRLKSFWHEPLGQADAVVCFLTPPAMRRLRTRVPHELKPGARFVTYAFPLPDAEPSLVDKPDRRTMSIYVYRRP